SDGNSPIFLPGMGVQHIQSINSFGRLPSSTGGGAIYSVRAPLVNACLPQLTWQTYDADFEMARFDTDGKLQKLPVMTLRLNGVLVLDRFELPENRPNVKPEGFSPKGGTLQLRAHNEPVVFRNIWLLEKDR